MLISRCQISPATAEAVFIQQVPGAMIGVAVGIDISLTYIVLSETGFWSGRRNNNNNP